MTISAPLISQAGSSREPNLVCSTTPATELASLVTGVASPVLGSSSSNIRSNPRQLSASEIANYAAGERECWNITGIIIAIVVIGGVIAFIHAVKN